MAIKESKQYTVLGDLKPPSGEGVAVLRNLLRLTGIMVSGHTVVTPVCRIQDTSERILNRCGPMPIYWVAHGDRQIEVSTTTGIDQLCVGRLQTDNHFVRGMAQNDWTTMMRRKAPRLEFPNLSCYLDWDGVMTMEEMQAKVREMIIPYIDGAAEGQIRNIIYQRKYLMFDNKNTDYHIIYAAVRLLSGCGENTPQACIVVTKHHRIIDKCDIARTISDTPIDPLVPVADYNDRDPMAMCVLLSALAITTGLPCGAVIDQCPIVCMPGANAQMLHFRLKGLTPLDRLDHTKYSSVYDLVAATGLVPQEAAEDLPAHQPVTATLEDRTNV